MKTFTGILFIVIWQLVYFMQVSASQDDNIPEEIILSIRAGNAAELAKFFYTNIELVILEKEDVYSKAQAEQILRKFFTDNHPTSFKIIFEGGKEVSRYAIGSLTASTGNFRVYFLIKDQDGSPLIHQLRIEKEDEDPL